MRPSQHPRVLVIDEDPRVRHAVAELLTVDGMPVATTADYSRTGAGLLDDAADVEVAIVDVRPVGPDDGLRLIAELAARIPVVATSATSAARSRALAAGAAAFADKDGDADRLVLVVRALAGRKRSLRPRGRLSTQGAAVAEPRVAAARAVLPL